MESYNELLKRIERLERDKARLLKDRNDLDRNLALALYDNGQLINRLQYLEHITKHLVVQ